MRNIHPFILFTFMAALLGAPSSVLGTTVISLIPDVVVEEAVVVLSDIATIQGGSPQTLEKVKSLEVTELSKVGAVDRISLSRIEYVLLLNGIDHKDARVDGEYVTVTLRGRRSIDEKVIDAIRSMSAAKFGVAESDFELQLTRPLPGLEHLMNSNRAQIRAFPLQTARLGSHTVRLGIYSDSKLTKTFAASVDVSLIRTVPVATRSVGGNKRLETGDFVWKSVATQRLETIPETTELVGMTVATRLKPGDMIRPTHISQRTATRQDYVVNARDSVKVIARKGPIRVTLGGAIALQRGRVGDTIRLRNPTSRKTMTARLISPSTAELRL